MISFFLRSLFPGWALCCVFFESLLSPALALTPNGSIDSVAEVSSIATQRPFWIALELNAPVGAYVPWFDPETGTLSITVAMTDSDGFLRGETILPVPVRDPQDGVYRFTTPVWILQEVIPPQHAPEKNSYELRGQVRWVACHEICFNYDSEFLIVLPAGEGLLSAETSTLFARIREAAPPLLRHPLAFETKEGMSTLTLFFNPQQYRTISVLPEVAGNKPVFASLQEFQKIKSGFATNFSGRDLENYQLIKGLVFAQAPTGMEHYRMSFANSGDVAPSFLLGSAPVLPLMTSVLFAFLGGLILNVMPCVFPVLSLKIFSVVKASHQPRFSFVLDGISYTAGVVTSFLAVALFLLTLRAGGEAVGWGFQLQSPIFVVTLLMIMFAAALNFIGLYDIRIPVAMPLFDQGHGTHRAFLTGVLAAVMATPCTAPLMTSALAAALTLPIPQALLIFTGLAFGLACPYLLVTLVPSAHRFFPKPGPWMAIVRRLLALPMLITIVWLLWVLHEQTGRGGLFTALTLMTLLLAVIGVWRFTARMTTGWRTWIVSLSCVVALSIGHTLYPHLATDFSHSIQKNASEQFSLDAVNTLRRQGRGVFVNFTARWCLTCLVNEQLIFSTTEFQEFLIKNNIAYLVADWTRPNENVAYALSTLGRQALPVYAFYPPGGPSKQVVFLSEVLTADLAKEQIEDALNNQ